MHEVKSKKRKLHLDRETILPLQRNALGTHILATVHGGEDKRDVRDRIVESAALSGVAGASVSAVAGSGAGAAVAGPTTAVASAVGASVDVVSQHYNQPCWIATTTASAVSRMTRR